MFQIKWSGALIELFQPPDHSGFFNEIGQLRASAVFNRKSVLPQTDIAIYRGFAYRPLYRYTAWRVVPTRYFCTER